MIETTTTEVASDFGKYLARVEQGESVLIRKQGRAVARLVPGSEFIDGDEFAKLFHDYKADALDKAAADEIEKNIQQMRREAEHDLAH